MTVTDPSVSTAGSLRTRALRRAIRRAPRARATVTTAGSPSGMAATARLTATRNIVSGDSPRATPAAKTTAQTTKASPASPLPRVERRRWSGVWPPACSCSSSATRPRAVDIPVVSTMPAPRPYTTAVPLKATLRWSARTPSGTSGSGSVVFSAGSDSPVRAASLIRSARASRRRRSAVTMSPASRRTRSPGTSSGAGTMSVSPSRTTRAVGLDMALRASRACSARYSWTKPTIPLRTTMARMTTVSLRSPRRAVMTAATISTTIIAFVNCSSSRRQGGFLPRSTSSLRP